MHCCPHPVQTMYVYIVINCSNHISPYTLIVITHYTAILIIINLKKNYGPILVASYPCIIVNRTKQPKDPLALEMVNRRQNIRINKKFKCRLIVEQVQKKDEFKELVVSFSWVGSLELESLKTIIKVFCFKISPL